MSRDSAYLNRRTLLAGLGAGAAVAATPAFGLRLADAGAERPSPLSNRGLPALSSAGLQEWRAVVGETFSLDSPDGSHLLRVAAVAAFPDSGPRPAAVGRAQAFSVSFDLVAGGDLPPSDRLYRLEHRAHPPLPVFMSAPVSSGRKTRLIAVFN